MRLKHSIRSRTSKVLRDTIDSGVYRKMMLKCDPYWDECIALYPQYKRGTNCSNKRLMRYEQRKFKTWKHNRKTQWKK